MTEVTDKMIDAAFPAFWRETKPYITMRERMRSAIEAALAARERVDAGELVQRLLNNPDVDCDIAADAIEVLVKALRWYASADAWTRHQLEDSDGDYGRRAREALTRLGVKL